ncbi:MULTISPECIES: DUF1292 domain-containing protein [Bacillales]|jgi:uncharacterized protein YrzB (UPF0473 family)|uniref:UPF0473 protein n=1 Tax=Brevibacillus aydinogluensis TaxID=927786 RepID=A0AA48MBA3_9BACL|nr:MULTISPECIES: DUF1292 domain-containing protein [Bacillales]REK64568.1 MAG: DUF1292 domain-containing protein [Brevibacillus sp.]MBR8659393.1 DUF1292 domain-containing protein [Brevibacillus sp. NL20B1]MDT3414442.1 uncharacterized protein YrzB (UPF0473 family) [Brevibacillus aydinogluensis]NNV02545.1 DUF1292 domain-containing protein [Brevibacillus sp. MCWH]UFJ60027.1 DUF1292 domain-containing protein [Anoxybacillus sediminis]
MSEELFDEFEVGDVIALTEEGDDNPRDFRIMYIFDIEDRTYLVLVPVDQEDEEEYEVHFLRYDGTDMLQPIEDDAEWEQVEATFETLIADLEKEEL